MKDFLKKFCPTAAKVLSVPLLLYCIFCCITELFGFDRVNGYLSSLQIPFNSKQILTVGGIVFLLWLTCYCVMAWFKSKEIRAAAEAEAKEHAASLDPGQTDTPLRTAARDVKCRILLEVYRRRLPHLLPSGEKIQRAGGQRHGLRRNDSHH